MMIILRLQPFIFILCIHLLCTDAISQESALPVSLELQTEIRETDDFFIGGLVSATLTPEQDILILDYHQKKVFVFDFNGTLRHSFGREGRGPGEFESPTVVKADHKGYIYIADFGNARVSIWNSDYTYRTDYKLVPGWREKMNRNAEGLFLSVTPFRKQPNGNDVFKIFTLSIDQKGLQPFYSYEYDAATEWFSKDRLFDSTSYWDITDEGKIVASGKFDYSPIRIIDSESGEVETVFSEEHEPITYTEEENEARLSRYPKGSEFRAIQAERTSKQIYTNIQVSNRDHIWVHRNKRFGEVDEIDIYNLEGEFETRVTLPASENELKMYGIYDEYVLFRVTTPIGEERLHVYRIEYE
jgi:hypothetical protein